MLTPSRPRSAPPTLRWLRSSQAPGAGRGRGAGRPGGTAFWSGREIRRGVTGKLVRVPGSFPVCFPLFGRLLPGSFPPYLPHGPLDPSLCHRPPWSSRRRPRGNDGGSGMRTEAAGRGRLGQACCDPVAAPRAPSGVWPRRLRPSRARPSARPGGPEGTPSLRCPRLAGPGAPQVEWPALGSPPIVRLRSGKFTEPGDLGRGHQCTLFLSFSLFIYLFVYFFGQVFFII